LILLHAVAIGMAVLYYDHLLNLSDEVKFIWTQPITKMRVLFVSHRYIADIAYLYFFLGMYLDTLCHCTAC
ncbi:hypothetical protein BC834DRAFT_837224, partial [Gloeopeniophorella convolvens]